MGKLRPRVRHPALPGTPRAKAGVATALSVRDAKAHARPGIRRGGRRARNTSGGSP
jgi:hypothetical protein